MAINQTGVPICSSGLTFLKRTRGLPQGLHLQTSLTEEGTQSTQMGPATPPSQPAESGEESRPDQLSLFPDQEEEDDFSNNTNWARAGTTEPEVVVEEDGSTHRRLDIKSSGY